MMTSIQCPECGYAWTPRVPRPRYCPRCKAWIQDRLSEKTALPLRDILPSGPLLEQSIAFCDVCGSPVTRAVTIGHTATCADCLRKLLEE